MMRYLLFILFFVAVIDSYSQEKGIILNGKATYYHNRFEGRKTANGEKFSQKKFTCAHKTLPINTFLKVTNLKNDKTTVLRVNDRLPMTSKVLLDLTYTAAKELDFIWKGSTDISAEIIDTANVNDTLIPLFAEAAKGMKIRKIKSGKENNYIVPLFVKDSALLVQKISHEKIMSQSINNKDTLNKENESKKLALTYGVQVLSYNSQEKARIQADQLMSQYNEFVSVKAKEINGKIFYRVIIGQYTSKSELVVLKSKLEKEYKGCYALALD